MLKIKDDVDLKELEKFGFEPRYDEKTGKIYRYISERSVKDKITKTRTSISSDVFVWEIHIQNLMLLFDLIRAGLVEKG